MLRYPISSYYASNRKALTNHLRNYHGEVSYSGIRDFLNPVDVNYLDNVQPGLYKTTAIPKEVRKAMFDATNIQPGFYKTKSIPKDVRKAMFDATNIQPGFYKTKSIPKEVRREMYDATNIQPGFYKTTAVPHEVRKQKYDKTKLARTQIDNALKVIKSIKNGKSVQKLISFDVGSFDSANIDYFHEHIGEVFMQLLNTITENQQWMCNYVFEGKVKTTPLNSIYAGNLLHQMVSENFISEVEAENSRILEADYDFFLTNIRSLTKLSFYDIDKYDHITMRDIRRNDIKNITDEELFKGNSTYKLALKRGDTELIDTLRKDLLKARNGGTQYRTRDGKFWRYTVNIPINLERYQIFDRVDKDTAKLMTSDNCLIYACIKAGVDADIIDHMREIIRVRAFPQSKLQTIANETSIVFTVTVVDINSETTAKNKKFTYKPKTITTDGSYTDIDAVPLYNVNLVLIDGHYMLNENINVSTFFIQHYEDIVKTCKDWTLARMMKVDKVVDGVYRINNSKNTSLTLVIKALFKYNRFTPITIGDIVTYSSPIYKERLEKIIKLEYDEKRCCRLKVQQKTKSKTGISQSNKSNKTKYEHVVYADFECSTDGIHQAFNICYESADGTMKGSFWGQDCAKHFLAALKDNTMVYFHNLTYDINFIMNELSEIIGTPIIKGSRTMMIEGKYKGHHLCFKDSYTVISKPLKMFPAMFNLETGPKEVFPYNYYTSSLLTSNNVVGNIKEASEHVSDKETFINNINSIPLCKIDKNHFDLEVYSKYYCEQDVRILKEGFERFRSDLLKEFNLDAYDFVSICSIANKYFEHNVYYKNGNLYDLSNTPREFISRCVQGGRCMLANNTKQIELTDEQIVDFDAVSLYPSAIARLYCVEGKPKVLTKKMLNTEYLLEHLFDDDQEYGTKDKFISSFYVEVRIKSIGINRDFPLVVVDKEFNKDLDVPRSSNNCCTMYVDHIGFQDLIQFQKCEMEVVRGYYYNGNRDHTIRTEVKKLFELRLKYKKEGNPLQEVIKLILNSIYGKTILKPIETKVKFIKDKDAVRFLRKNYNSIVELEPLYNSNTTMFKQLKSIVRHFNFCPLGVNILSMSKRIMNEVFTTAEDAGMHVFYQDTDSGHYYAKDIPVLQKVFSEKYHRELIGKNLGQFHSDFAEIDNGHQSTASKSIFVGKKTYIDQLTNDINSVAFHIRTKGVKQDVIAIKANELFPNAIPVNYNEASGLFVPEYVADSKQYSVMELFKSMYNGDAIEFDLCAGKNPCFEHKNNFTITTKRSFIRKLQFK